MIFSYWVLYQLSGVAPNGETYSGRQTAELEFDEELSSFAQVRMAEGLLYGRNREMLEEYSNPSCVIKEFKLLHTDQPDGYVEGTYYYWCLYELSGVSARGSLTKFDSYELISGHPIMDLDQIRDEEQKILDRSQPRLRGYSQTQCVILTWQLLRLEQNVFSRR